ncbi:MAG TPA: ligase-associated DNA damage response exonuclease [Verrucomicrobiales bacterium]|nr:ligase-associated DNA damage response exonuclease [Verrucomicrobiales bacterium]
MLIRPTPSGLYCEQGDFYIDPKRKVNRAVITHAHSDHARRGSEKYLCSKSSEPLLRLRLGKSISIQALEYGISTSICGVIISFHPAGHILGSAQVRIAYKGEVWVVSGDYKTYPDPTCAPFEPLSCHTFISECTFGYPIYRWPDPNHEWNRLENWWKTNREAGLSSVINAYSLGKAQRILNALKDSEQTVLVHSAILSFLPFYISEGVLFPKVMEATPENIIRYRDQALIISPPSSRMEKSLGDSCSWQSLDVSGWNQIRSQKRKKNLPNGLIVSDHANWEGLCQAIQATEAEQTFLTHGDGSVLSRWLTEKGLSVSQLPENISTASLHASQIH